MKPGIRALCAAVAIVWGACGADAVYINGNVITMGAGVKMAQAFLVEGNRFTKVGTTDEVLKVAKPGTPRIDLRGRTVVPGLNDSHTTRLARRWRSRKAKCR